MHLPVHFFHSLRTRKEPHMKKTAELTAFENTISHRLQADLPPDASHVTLKSIPLNFIRHVAEQQAVHASREQGCANQQVHRTQ